MRITLVLKGIVNALPPILSLCKTLLDLQYQLTLICDTISDHEKQLLTERGCKIVTLKQAAHVPTKAGTVLRWMVFRKNAWKAISENPADFYWIGSADTALALGKSVLRLRYILHVHELYDTVPRYREGLKDFMRHAVKVFVPEETRAHIFRAWYQLKENPVVLPNKPYDHPRKRNLTITDPAAAAAFAKIPKNAKILFYQGLIYRERDLRPIAKAVELMHGKIVLAVQGKMFDDEYCRDFQANYHFYYIPYIPAPRHLEVTSHMDIGLVSYDHINLNNEFCAPNKVWEYAGFGIPMLGNDVLGLQHVLNQKRIGIPVNQNQKRPETIVHALQQLLEQYSEYAQKAVQFFDSVQMDSIVADVMTEITSGRENK